MTKQEALKIINDLPSDAEVTISITDRYVSSSEIERLGVSRPRLKYWADSGYVRTIAKGKQKRYSLEDALKLKDR